MSHTCHAKGCTANCKPEYLMCWNHWRRVPRRVQAAVYRYYQEGQCDLQPSPSREWHIAADAAIAAVALKEDRITQEQADVIMGRLAELLELS